MERLSDLHEPDTVPRYVAFALDLMGMWGEAEDEYPHRFLACWGDFSPSTLAQAAQRGEEVDHLFAILALGYSGVQHAHAILRPMLAAQEPATRWASALGLAELGETDGVPILCDLLLAELPVDTSQLDRPLEGLLSYSQLWRRYAVKLLGVLGDRRAVPALCHALSTVATLLKEDALYVELSHAEAFGDRRNWMDFQADVIYSAGQLAAWGALTMTPAIAKYRELWMVHLVLGQLLGRLPPLKIQRRWSYPPLGTELRHVLSEQYGLLPDEQETILARYDSTLGIYLHSRCLMDSYRMQDQKLAAIQARELEEPAGGRGDR